MPLTFPKPSQLSNRWMLDPNVVYLNHGSFGACPITVLKYQQQLRDRLETQPIKFLSGDYWEFLNNALRALGSFLGAKRENIAFVRNATQGVNTVIKSLNLRSGDEILVGSHEYDASRNAAEHWARKAGAKIVEVQIPFPITDSDVIVDRLLSGVTAKTRLLLVDHVTSATGLIFPIKELVAEFSARGIDVLVDGAHAPGMLDLDLDSLGAAYYTGNCHKWICAPKGAAFLYVRQDKQPDFHPLSISHGYGFDALPSGVTRFNAEFDWTGTDDPTPLLSCPEAIRYIGGLLPGGWPQVRDDNHQLACAGRKLVCDALQIESPAPEAMLGSLAAIMLPLAPDARLHSFDTDPLKEKLTKDYRIEVPIYSWPGLNSRILRISAQLYNSLDQYQYLAQALKQAIRAANN